MHITIITSSLCQSKESLRMTYCSSRRIRNLVQMEMDLCWMNIAGQDPIKYFERYPGRFPAGAREGCKENSAEDRRCAR